MTLSTEQQIATQLEGNSRILVCLPENPSTDAISSGLALTTVLHKMGKEAKVVAAGFALPDTHRFLPKSETIDHTIEALRKFVISVDISKNKVQDLTYDIQGNTLNIFVQPTSGAYSPNDVNTGSQQYDYDLIIVLDCRELNSLGQVFTNNAEFFHHTPMVNIDHHPGNEQFGQINLLDVTSTSVSEMIYNLLEHVEGEHLDEAIATSLLTGIISKTKSFKTNSVTPRSLAIASLLIDAGARREDIIKNLYQTKSIQSLQLWGRTLSKLESDPDHKIVWSILQQEDFLETKTTHHNLEAVIDELIVNTPDAQHIYIVYEEMVNNHLEVKALIHTQPYIDGKQAFRDWGSIGTDNFTYVTVPHSSVQMAQQMIHDRLRSLMK